MKLVTLQVTLNVPNNYHLYDEDDIHQLLIDTFDSSRGGGGVFMNGYSKIISIK